MSILIINSPNPRGRNVQKKKLKKLNRVANGILDQERSRIAFARMNNVKESPSIMILERLYS